jgi:hypothetical protein
LFKTNLTYNLGEPKNAIETIGQLRTTSLLSGFLSRNPIITKQMIDYLCRFFEAIQEVTGAQAIIDISKVPGYGILLRMLPNIDFYLLHLVRDPRATGYSWQRTKLIRPDSDEQMNKYNLVMNSLTWLVWNRVLERQFSNQHYQFVKYEDFLKRPEKVITSALTKMNFPLYGSLPFVEPNKVRLTPKHIPFGNPNRFNNGIVEIKPDNEWLDKMKPLSKLAVTGITWPYLLKYQYPIWP